jgi:hypothetical protein
MIKGPKLRLKAIAPRMAQKTLQELKEWVPLIWGFAKPILNKQAVVMIQKLLKLEEQLFKIILKSTVI